MELRVEHIQKTYGTKIVLDDVTFSLSQGQKVGLVGNNGSGKTTLFKILMGEVEADAGEITRRQGLITGYLPQDTSLVSDETVRKYVHRVSGMQDLEQRCTVSRCDGRIRTSPGILIRTPHAIHAGWDGP